MELWHEFIRCSIKLREPSNVPVSDWWLSFNYCLIKHIIMTWGVFVITCSSNSWNSLAHWDFWAAPVLTILGPYEDKSLLSLLDLWLAIGIKTMKGIFANSVKSKLYGGQKWKPMKVTSFHFNFGFSVIIKWVFKYALVIL